VLHVSSILFNFFEARLFVVKLKYVGAFMCACVFVCMLSPLNFEMKNSLPAERDR
jgi:hypothetical protein